MSEESVWYEQVWCFLASHMLQLYLHAKTAWQITDDTDPAGSEVSTCGGRFLMPCADFS